MIQANELRIGNAVQDDTGRIGIITEVSKNSVRLKMEFSILKIDTHHDEQGVDVTPIPLTPEILEKAGFKEDINGHYCKQLMTHEIELIINGEDYYPIYIQFAELSSENEQRVSLNKINSVHQLQNLYFALTQTELNIKL